METNNIHTDIKNFDGVFYIALLIKHKIFILIVTAISCIASVIITLIMPNWYSATVNAVPPKKAIGSLFENAMSNISSTLREFGLTKLKGGQVEGYSYLVLLNSRTVKDSMIQRYNLAKEYEIPDSLHTEILQEFENNIEIEFESEGNYSITVTDKKRNRVADMANTYINITNSLAEKILHTEATKSKEYIENRLNTIDATIKVIADSLQKFSRKTFLFSPMDQASSISSAYADIKAELIQQEIMHELLKNKYGENDPYTQIQKDLIAKIRNKVSEVESKPGFAGNFPLKNATSVGLEYLRLYAEYETFSKVKGFLQPMLEDARLDESRQTMSLVVVDPAVKPDKKSKPKRSIIVLGATFGGFALSILLVLLVNGYYNLKNNYKSFIDNSKNKV
ncbi:MAG: hypothetical protein A2X61_12960 [Ignavibacteria bacterium GWB2_35_12]|nr:MAG: hypothetical protein A2X63_11845 [Ignavibacteria bacterium GWA2_35_8]OGU41374.1 MAG: hypothetical protein A2X61_12960 [Ignavibacteria bacterium GWB2_35_12]OGV19449.1 MAG: hypothetical protein A2475_05130 [Ignavibacteria bacterium RIFOXYC2_FULL_35_21]